MSLSIQTVEQRKSRWRKFRLSTLFLLVTLCACGIAWRLYTYERATINQWIDVTLAENENHPIYDFVSATTNPPTPQAQILCPRKISQSEQIRLLMKSLYWLPSEERRNCVLKILAEQFPGQAHALFLKLAAEPPHEDLRRKATLLASLYRVESDLDVFLKLLDHNDPTVRTAAIDAIGIVYEPTYSIPSGYDRGYGAIYLMDEPRVDLKNIRDINYANKKPPKNQVWRRDFSWKNTPASTMSPELLARFRKIMAEDLDPKVRAAGARVLVNRPLSGYRLRVAEWGVWVNQGKDLRLVQSLIDEIPPFVHRTGNSLDSIRDGRVSGMTIINKPIIHIVVDQPLAIDLSVWIHHGRPWFGFPRPDDFSVLPTHRPESKLELPPVIDGELEDLREGYSWVGPQHNKRNMPGNLKSVGFRWQSLIALPEQASWMNLEPVTEKKYDWWNRLRQVPCSWVSNRGETERFIYYDGPTSRPSPVMAIIEGNKVKLTDPAISSWDPFPRKLLYIEVKAGVLSARDEIHDGERNPSWREFEIDSLPMQGQGVVKRFRELLIELGLNRSEADGLIDCWRVHFFETEGRRLLTIFDKRSYGGMCPMFIRPQPTELARVGIVLTEFDQQAPILKDLLQPEVKPKPKPEN